MRVRPSPAAPKLIVKGDDIMGFRYCSFEERTKIEETDMRLIEPLKELVWIAEDRLEREENIDELERKCLYLETKDNLDHFFYAIIDVPSDSLKYGLFVYRMRCGEHELPLELPDCMLLPKSSEFVTAETCYHLRGVWPETILETVKHVGDGDSIKEARWDWLVGQAQHLVREGYISIS